MFGLGFGELIVLLAIVLLVFGVGKLPQLGDGLGRAIKNFKRSASGHDEIDVTPKKEIADGTPAAPASSETSARANEKQG